MITHAFFTCSATCWKMTPWMTITTHSSTFQFSIFRSSHWPSTLRGYRMCVCRMTQPHAFLPYIKRPLLDCDNLRHTWLSCIVRSTFLQTGWTWVEDFATIVSGTVQYGTVGGTPKDHRSLTGNGTAGKGCIAHLSCTLAGGSGVEETGEDNGNGMRR